MFLFIILAAVVNPYVFASEPCPKSAKVDAEFFKKYKVSFHFNGPIRFSTADSTESFVNKEGVFRKKLGTTVDLVVHRRLQDNSTDKLPAGAEVTIAPRAHVDPEITSVGLPFALKPMMLLSTEENSNHIDLIELHWLKNWGTYMHVRFIENTLGIQLTCEAVSNPSAHPQGVAPSQNTDAPTGTAN